MKCNLCGGTCVEMGGGKYQCEFCGNVFSGSDIEVKRTKSARQYNGVKDCDTGADLFESNIVGALELSCQGKSGSWSGSGYIITDNGYAITNAHVAADDDGSPCRKITVNVCDQCVGATVVALADNKAGHGNGVDLALIKLDRMPFGAKKLNFENFNNVKTGERVYVIGNSLGDGACITSGIVSDRRRVLNGKTLLMTDCAINGGNSGGPIFNERGLVIGTICSERIKRDGSATKGMNYAVPADIVVEFIKKNGIRV